MCWVRTDERGRIWEASGKREYGWTAVDVDVTAWKLLDEGVPLYEVKDGRVVKRSDADVKRDKKDLNLVRR